MSGRTSERTVEERLQAIEDRFALVDLEADYVHGWDFGTPDQWAEVFTEDGHFEMLPAGSIPHTLVAGRAELEAFCSHIRKGTSGARWSGLHFMHPPRLKIDGDRAESLIFFEFRHLMQAADNSHSRQGVTAGYYRTRYVRTGQGWRIEHRIEQAVSEELSLFFGLEPPLPAAKD